MRGYNKWSYAPYKPFLTEIGDIYICRIVLYRDKVHFEWLDISAEKYTVYFKKRVEEQFIFAGNTSKCEFTIENLNENEDYEFFVIELSFQNLFAKQHFMTDVHRSYKNI